MSLLALMDLPKPETVARFTVAVTKPLAAAVYKARTGVRWTDAVAQQYQRDRAAAFIAQGLTSAGKVRKHPLDAPKWDDARRLQRGREKRAANRAKGLTGEGKPRKR